MKPGFVLSISLSVLLTVAAQAQAHPPDSARIVEGYGKLPLAFEANQGQSDPQVKFLSRGAGYSLFLTADAALLALQPPAPSPPGAGRFKNSHPQSTRAVLRMKLVNTNPRIQLIGQDELPGKSNYFIGNDPKKWLTNVRQFSKVRYENVYPGVDLVYYGHQRELEYDFVLQPGASPQAIRLGIAGARRLRLEHGDLVLTSGTGEVHLRSPRIYQEADGVRHNVRGRYLIKNDGEVGFAVAMYDRRRTLVIDPVLAYATYLGGSSDDDGSGVAVDSAGNAYITGTTFSTDFPTVNAIQPTFHGGRDVFVTKINADGTALGYSTYLGGSVGSDFGVAIALDSAGSAYVAGMTDSLDFPTVNAIQSTSHGNLDLFVTKINAGGNALVYSTYLGGSGNDFNPDVAVDSTGNAYLTGLTGSTDFPTKNPFQSAIHDAADVFVTEINAAGSGFVYSTYLGGNDFDGGNGIAVDSTGNAYVTGVTSSTDFPTVNAIQSSPTGGFLSKINAGGTAFIYSTYLSSSFRRIVVDSANSAYLVGSAGLGYPTTPAAFQLSPHGSDDAVIAKVASETFVHLSTQKLTFPTQVIGTTSTPKKVNFTNRGSGTLTIHKIYIGGLNPRNFAQTNNCGTTLAPSTSCAAFVTFTPSAKDKRQAGLGFSTPDPASPDAVALSGTGTVVSLSASKLTFGDQALGTTSPPQNLMLTNTGSTQLNFGLIYILGMNAGNFSQTNNCGTSIAAKASCTIAVTFTPTATGIRTAALYIRDDGGGSPQKVNLTGTGT